MDEVWKSIKFRVGCKVVSEIVRFEDIKKFQEALHDMTTILLRIVKKQIEVIDLPEKDSVIDDLSLPSMSLPNSKSFFPKIVSLKSERVEDASVSFLMRFFYKEYSWDEAKEFLKLLNFYLDEKYDLMFIAGDYRDNIKYALDILEKYHYVFKTAVSVGSLVELSIHV